MSAFLCTEDHLGALCDAALAWNVEKQDAKIHEVFAMLARENLASLTARYDGQILKEWWTARVAEYKYMRSPVCAPVKVLKLIDSYEYQSCEHDLWIVSEAEEWCERLRRVAIHKLPGYDAAEWAI